MPGRARPAADAAARSRSSQRASVVGLPVAGLAEPIRVNIDFETGVVDQIIEWLTVVRALQPANNPTSCDARSSPMQVYVCVTGSPTRHARPSRTTMARKSPEAGAGPTHHRRSRTRRGLKKDRPTLDHRLQQAEALVGRIEEVLQRQMIAAKMFLRQLEAKHARHVADRDRLFKQLAKRWQA